MKNLSVQWADNTTTGKPCAEIIILLVLAIPAANNIQTAVTDTWNVESGGLWSTTGNWSGGVPGAYGDTANLTKNITATRVITNDVSQSIGTVNIGGSSSSYFAFTLTNKSGVTLTFDNSGSGANLVQAATTADDVSPLFCFDHNGITTRFS